MVTKEMVQAIVDKYQALMGLNDWLITVEIVDEHFLQIITQNTNSIVFGATRINLATKISNIYIWENADVNIINTSLEWIVVHEMVHIIIQPFKNHFEKTIEGLEQDDPLRILLEEDFVEIEEQIVNEIAKIILRLSQTKLLSDADNFALWAIVQSLGGQNEPQEEEENGEEKNS